MTKTHQTDNLPEPRWLQWAKQLNSIGNNGLLYAKDHYERERNEQILRVAAEMIATQTNSPDLRPILDLLKHDSGYITPKVDVRGVIFKNDKILLVRELADENRWTLPGGWADPNDSPSHAAEREILEETGYITKAVQLLAIYNRSDPRHGHHPPTPLHCYKIFFLCNLTGGQPKTSNETGESGFFNDDEIPHDLSIARVTKSQLQQFFKMHRTRCQTTDFD